MIRRIFISSTQRELAEERKAIVDCVSANPQLARFFSTFAFEFDVPVQDKRTDEVYLAELASSSIARLMALNRRSSKWTRVMSASRSSDRLLTRMDEKSV